MTTITTLFSGGEGVSIGAKAAGITHLDGFEYDNDIAQVARNNGFNVHIADVLTLDPHTLQVPDILHCSPVCTRASVANQSAELNEDGTKEAPLDIEFGQKIALFIDVMQPRIFTLENVYAYRKFKAFKIICTALDRNGYFWDYDNLNSADYGVPQTRRRLILRAMRGSLLPMLPQPVRWVGWYDSVSNLIPDFSEVTAPWLKNSMSEFTSDDFILAEAVNMKRKPTLLSRGQPSMTLTVNLTRRPSHIPSIWIDGIGRHLSIKALARLQTLPLSYRLPNNPILAGKIITNSVPPLLYQRIIMPMIALL